ncbi:MAG: CPBP family intramembrane glutamic endopeptidase [Ilumatobacteraceae bacterium]
MGSLFAAPLVVVLSGGAVGENLGVFRLALVASVGWAVFLAALALVSRRSGSGRFATDFSLSIRPVDAAAVPLGVAGQLLLVPAVYVPLRAVWPDVFDPTRISERAEELVGGATGVEIVLLVAVVAIGAPLIEELVYRGLLQRSAAERFGRGVGVVGVSLLFALIHLSPVEYPGLFVAGLLFGGCAALTGRLGPAVLAHAAFNATGVYTVLT